MPKLLAHFLKSHPGVGFRLTIHNREEILAELRANTVDFVIIGRPPQELECVATPFAPARGPRHEPHGPPQTKRLSGGLHKAAGLKSPSSGRCNLAKVFVRLPRTLVATVASHRSDRLLR